MAAAPQSQSDESLADIGRQIADDATRLVRLEIELAKAGAKETAKRFLVAVILLVLALPLLIIATTFAVAALPMHYGDTWWAWALTGAGAFVVALIFAGAAGLAARAGMRRQKEAISGIKEDVAWVRQLTRRNSRSS